MSKGKKVKHKVHKHTLEGYRCRDNDSLECPLCGAVYTANEWDKETYKMVSTDEERKDFRSVTLNISKRNGVQELKYYYTCPNCQTLISGNRFTGVIISKSSN